jgi:purine-nucleoside phosphorylase
MSIHISALAGEIAPVVLMPGDPLRAKFIAETFLSGPSLVSSTRNVLYYTGMYRDKRITVGASGMGCPSIGIYSYELFTQYDVQCIIRIGTCGAYTSDLKLYDLINVEQAASESTFARYAWGFEEPVLSHQGNAFKTIEKTAAATGKTIRTATVHSSDIFYRKDSSIPAIAATHNCLAVEMEAFALFANARHLGKTAATLLTVSDIIPTHEAISAGEREQALRPMMELGLESAANLL